MTLLLLFKSSGGGATGTAFESFVGGGMYLGRWEIDDYLTFAAQTHDSTGAAAAADSAPTYAIYEDETAVALVTGTMAALGAVDGLYTERVQLTAAAGFAVGQCYTVRVAATVGGVVAAKADQFQVEAAALSAQEVRDAMKLAPTAGDPAAGSVDKHLDDALAALGSTDYGLSAIKTLVEAVPTNSELATALAGADDAVLAAIAALNNLSSAGAQAAAAAALAAYGVALETTVAAVKAKTDLLTLNTTPTVVSQVDGGLLTIVAGTTFDPDALTGLTVPANWVEALWTVKARDGQPDSAALIQVRLSNPAAAGDGLQRLNGAAAGTAAHGSLTVATGQVQPRLEDDATALLTVRERAIWDVKFICADGSSDQACSGTLRVVRAVTDEI